VAGEPEKIVTPDNIRSFVIPINWQPFGATGRLPRVSRRRGLSLRERELCTARGMIRHSLRCRPAPAFPDTFSTS